MRNRLYLKAGVVGVILPVLIASALAAQTKVTPGVRQPRLEDVVAALFQHARNDAGLRPLNRIHRSDVEKLVCTASVIGASHDDRMPLPLNTLYKTAEPDKMNDALRTVAAYRGHVGFRRFAVAVWTVQPQTIPPQYWIGIRLYMSAGAEFVDNNFTDDVFTKGAWKHAVVPQCKRASSKP